MGRVVIIGSGLAGLSCAHALAERGISSWLVSPQRSERAASVLAEGGINAALDVMGEGDTWQQHFEDTMSAGRWLADARSVAGLCHGAPDVVRSNGALNGIGPERLSACAGDILSDASLRKNFGTGYDLVLSNIVSDVIIPLSRFVRDFLSEDGVFITSGIIEGRQDEVRAALEGAGLTIVKHRCEEEWHCYTCVAAQET